MTIKLIPEVYGLLKLNIHVRTYLSIYLPTTFILVMVHITLISYSPAYLNH